jgi:hypothetical protein
MPLKPSASPSVSVSPICSWPWLWMPMMSPATASSLATRSLAMKVSALASFISFAVRTVAHLHARRVAARADAEEGDAVAVLRVHVGLDLEDEAGERRFGRLHHAHAAVARLRRRRPVDQRLQDLAHAEVVDARAEEHRALLPARKAVEVEGRAGAADQLDVLAQLAISIGKSSSSFGVVEALDQLASPPALLARREAHQLVVQQVDRRRGRLAHAERPGDRRAVDLQHRLDLLEQLERLAHLAVELVDEGDDRRVAQAADLEQLDGLRSTPLAASITITAASTAVSTR